MAVLGVDYERGKAYLGKMDHDGISLLRMQAIILNLTLAIFITELQYCFSRVSVSIEIQTRDHDDLTPRTKEKYVIILKKKYTIIFN